MGRRVSIHQGVIIKYPNEIEVGDYVTFNHYCYIVGKGGLKIGNHGMFGAGVKLVTSTHGFNSMDVSMREQKITYKPISIGNDTWFGFNAVVLGGSDIHNGCIVGANALVNKEFEPFSIVGGVPAKLIKKRT